MAKHKILPILKRFSLEKKVVLITGGAGLIGSGFSRACAEAGAKVIIVEIDAKRGEYVAKKINHAMKSNQVFFEQCDISNTEEVDRLVNTVIKKHKKIDALVNNAFPRNKNWGSMFEDVTYEDFCENVDMHVGGYFLMTQAVAKIMKKQKAGTIVSMGSIYGISAPKFSIYEDVNYSVDDAHKPMTTPVEYSAIKGAIVNLTKYWASYLGIYGIRVNAISPGGIFDHQPEKFVQKYSERVLLGKRMGEVEDLTGALVFLLSDGSRYITGQNLVVDGGWTI